MAAMDSWRRRAWLSLGVVFLLGGWLAPQYASKLWGTALQKFLQDSPLSAGFVGQMSWMLLLLPNPLGRRREQQLPDPAVRCRCCAGQAARQGWLLAMQLGLLVATVHGVWYASFSRTNVATNTLLWNTDTLTTPFFALVISSQRPTAGAMIGGLVGLLGACVAVGACGVGDTLLGCGLVFSASCGFAVNAVLVEKVRDPRLVPVTKLLGLEGVVATAAVCLAGLGAAAWRPEAISEWYSALPPFGWLLLMGGCSLVLNIGWLWCTELASASWTAMVACSTIPLTVVLDTILMGTQPAPATLLGSCLVLLGFAIASRSEPAAGDTCCQRWQGWGQATAAPLLPSPESESTAASGACGGPACSEDACSTCSGDAGTEASPAETEESQEAEAEPVEEQKEEKVEP